MGIYEIIIIAIIFLVIFRPEDFPRILYKGGKVYGKISSYFSRIKHEINLMQKDFEADEAIKKIKESGKDLLDDE